MPEQAFGGPAPNHPLLVPTILKTHLAQMASTQPTSPAHAHDPEPCGIGLQSHHPSRCKSRRNFFPFGARPNRRRRMVPHNNGGLGKMKLSKARSETFRHGSG